MTNSKVDQLQTTRQLAAGGKWTYQVHYTRETRGVATRRTKEVCCTQAQLEKTVAKLEDNGAYNVEVRAESTESRQVFG